MMEWSLENILELTEKTFRNPNLPFQVLNLSSYIFISTKHVQKLFLELIHKKSLISSQNRLNDAHNEGRGQWTFTSPIRSIVDVNTKSKILPEWKKRGFSNPLTQTRRNKSINMWLGGRLKVTLKRVNTVYPS